MFAFWQVFWLVPLLSAFPSQPDSGIWMVIKGFGRTYSSGNCSGFSPDSLFAPHMAETKTGAKIGLIYVLKGELAFFFSDFLKVPHFSAFAKC